MGCWLLAPQHLCWNMNLAPVNLDVGPDTVRNRIAENSICGHRGSGRLGAEDRQSRQPGVLKSGRICLSDVAIDARQWARCLRNLIGSTLPAGRLLCGLLGLALLQPHGPLGEAAAGVLRGVRQG